MEKRKRTKYLIVNKNPEFQCVGYFCLNEKLNRLETHLSQIREMYYSQPEKYSYLQEQLIHTEQHIEELRRLLTGYFDFIVVLPEE